ncbi:hypothetical protein GCM10027037_07390 [Mucilaginibacter koreensis]
MSSGIRWVYSLFVFVVVLLTTFSAGATTYDWRGSTTSSNWTTASNWTASDGSSTYPGQVNATSSNPDIVRIGVSSTAYSSQPNIAAGTTINVASVTFGSTTGVSSITAVYATTLTVNGTLNVSGDITDNANKTNREVDNYLAGSGIINCSNINVGNTTSLGGNNNFFFSYVSTLNISGNVNILISLSVQNGSGFRLESGNMYLNGKIIISNSLLSTSSNAAYFTINGQYTTSYSSGVTSGTKTTPSLYLASSAALAAIPTPYASINFNGSGTSGGDVTVRYTGVSPTIYTTSTPGFGSGGGNINTSVATYNNLVVESSGTAVAGTGAGVLKIDKALTTNSPLNLVTYTNTTTIGTNWTNSSTITGGSGSTDINGSLTNSGTMTMGAGAITIAGNYTNSSIFTQGTGLITFDGTTAQTLTDNSAQGTTFSKVTFSGAGAKTMAAGVGNFAVSGTGLLTMVSPAVLNAGTSTAAYLTLLSTAASSATIARMPSGASIVGNVNVQRYIIGGSTKVNGVYTARAYRLLTSPVNISSSISGGGNINPGYLISSGMLVSGPGGTTNGFTQANNNPTLYVFNESGTNNNTTFISGKHRGITKIYSTGNINTSDGGNNIPLPVGNGYIVYYIGNNTNASAKATAAPTVGPEDMVVTATGTLNQNNVAVNLWYTPAGATTTTTNKLSYSSALGINAGLNMVGNPYASTLDLNAVISGNTGITNSVYELDNANPSQGYIVYSTTGTSSPRASRYVVSGQGFLVRANSANQTLTFTETMKAEQLVPSVILMGIPKQTDALAGFYMKIEQDSLLSTYCGIYFSPDWTDQFGSEDAVDMNSTSSAVLMSSYTADGRRVALNKLSDYTQGKTIKLNVNAANSNLYKIKIENIRGIDTLYNVWLRDKYLKDSLNIRRYGVYNFRINKSDTASFGANRFELAIRPRPLAPYQLVNFKAEKVSEGIKITWKAYNEGTYTGFNLQRKDAGSTGFYDITQLQSNGNHTYSYIDRNPVAGLNDYRLVQNDINNHVSYSMVISVDNTLLTDQNLMRIYPNPAVQTINLTVKSTEAGNCAANIYNTAGQLMMRRQVNTTVSAYDVSPLKPGTYMIQLTRSNGELIGQSKFIKN